MSIFCVAGILMGFSITHSGFEVNAQLSTVKGSKIPKEILCGITQQLCQNIVGSEFFPRETRKMPKQSMQSFLEQPCNIRSWTNSGSLSPFECCTSEMYIERSVHRYLWIRTSFTMAFLAKLAVKPPFLTINLSGKNMTQDTHCKLVLKT